MQGRGAISASLSDVGRGALPVHPPVFMSPNPPDI